MPRAIILFALISFYLPLFAQDFSDDTFPGSFTGEFNPNHNEHDVNYRPSPEERTYLGITWPHAKPDNMYWKHFNEMIPKYSQFRNLETLVFKMSSLPDENFDSVMAILGEIIPKWPLKNLKINVADASDLPDWFFEFPNVEHLVLETANLEKCLVRLKGLKKLKTVSFFPRIEWVSPKERASQPKPILVSEMDWPPLPAIVEACFFNFPLENPDEFVKHMASGLTQLKKLRFQGCSLTEIPNNLEKMGDLTRLYLNNLYTSFPNEIKEPEVIVKMPPSLSRMVISHKARTPFFSPKVKNMIPAHCQLDELDEDHSSESYWNRQGEFLRLYYGGRKPISEQENVRVWGSDVNKNPAFYTQLNQYKAMKRLRISLSPADGEAYASYPDYLNTALPTLNPEAVMIHPKAIPSMIGGLGATPKLKTLALEMPKLESVPEEVGQLKNLKGLELIGTSRGQNTEIDFKSLEKVLLELDELRELTLVGIQIDDLPGALILFSKIENLEVLRLLNCGITNLPGEINRLKKLVDLQIHALPQIGNKNHFTALPEALYGMDHLRRIVVSHTKEIRILRKSIRSRLPANTYFAIQSGCFPANAEVALLDGRSKAISTVEVGDLIAGVSADSLTSTEVVWVDRHDGGNISLCKVIFSTNEISANVENSLFTRSFEATANHPILMALGNKKLVDELKVGDQILQRNAISGKLESVLVVKVLKDFRSVPEVFNLVTTSGNYLVNGIAVSVK